MKSEVIRLKITHYKDFKRRTQVYRYFISYSFSNAYGNGQGNVEVMRFTKFGGINDVKEWAREYEKEMNFNHKSLVVLNFQLL